jgi:predicted transcriptional regulator
MLRGLYQRVKRKSSKGLEKFLGQLELAVMEIVWEQETVSVAHVLAALNEANRNLAYTSVMTVMGRLVEKGWLAVEKQGRAYIYRAARSRQEAEAVAVGEVVRALVDDFGDVAIAQFIKELEEVEPQQLARLRELTRDERQSDSDPA